MRYLLGLLLLTFSAIANAQVDGTWVGELNVGRKLPLVFNITSKDSMLSVTMDSPEQKAMGIPADITINKDSVLILVKVIGGRYVGQKIDNFNIKGAWQQAGATFPLALEKKNYVPKESDRPQTPKPPFSYTSENVYYYNADSSIRYGATITLPKDNAKHPAMLLISGSGPQNRDGEIFGHKPFAVIADYLTKKGYIILRTDDRGVGENTGSRSGATSATYAKDALEGVEYLMSRPEVDKDKIGLIGHSEGGMIAEMLAAENKDIDFVILLAAPGVKINQLLTEQNLAITRQAGIKEEMLTAYRPLYENLIHEAQKAKSTEEMEIKLMQEIRKWRAKTDSLTVAATTGIYDQASEDKYLDAFVSTLDNAWMKYFIAFNPEPYLKKIDAKVLALNGSKDVQVISKSNLEGIRKTLPKKKGAVQTIQEIEGLNHLFQTCKTCTVSEYEQLEETFSPVALDVMAGWLKAYVD
jgi:pimeloyl-ACP methyl ester carboxylesterase